VAEERLEQRSEALQAVGCVRRRLDDHLVEDRGRPLHGRELQLLLRAEVREQPALAHADALGEPREREPVEAFDRREARRLVEDRLTGADAVAARRAQASARRRLVHA
jgi:hypothetical protein